MNHVPFLLRVANDSTTHGARRSERRCGLDTAFRSSVITIGAIDTSKVISSPTSDQGGPDASTVQPEKRDSDMYHDASCGRVARPEQ